MITVIGLEEKDKKGLVKFAQNILGIEDLVVVIMGHLINNPGIMERIEYEVVQRGRKAVFVGGRKYDYLKITGESSPYDKYDKLVKRIYWVENIFLMKDIRLFIKNPI